MSTNPCAAECCSAAGVPKLDNVMYIHNARGPALQEMPGVVWKMFGVNLFLSMGSF